MTFLLRIIPAVILAVLIFFAILGCILLVTWAVNRGLQLFFGLFGYEVTDFFSKLVGFLARSFGVKKKKLHK